MKKPRVKKLLFVGLMVLSTRIFSAKAEQFQSWKESLLNAVAQIAAQIGLQNIAHYIEKYIVELQDMRRKSKITETITFKEYSNPPQNAIRLVKEIKEQKERIPRGIFIIGTSSAEKNDLVRAIAGELDCPLLSYSPSDFIKGGPIIRQAFIDAREVAKKYKKEIAIIFIDQMDTIERKSSDFSLETFLTQMNEVQTSPIKVIVIGAITDLQNIDHALLQQGRFDKIIHITKNNLISE